MKRLLLFLYALIPIFSLYSDVLFIPTSVLCIITLFLSIIYLKNQRISIDIFDFLNFFIVLLIVFSVFFHGNVASSIKFSTYFITLIVFPKVLRLIGVESIIRLTIKLLKISLIILIPVTLILAIKFIGGSHGLDYLNVRNYLPLEKQSYTNILLVSLTVTTMKYMFSNNKRYYFLLFILLTIFGVGVLQIKTILIISCIYMCIMFRKYALIMIGIVLFIIVLFAEKSGIISQFLSIIKYIINPDSLSSSELILVDTYIIRVELIEKCIDIFKENLVMGVGFENFSNFADNSWYIYSYRKNAYLELASVTENGYLQLLVEGGIIIFIFVSIQIIRIIRSGLKIYKYNQYTAYVFLGILGMLILNAFQDNLSYIFWYYIILALTYINFSEYYQQSKRLRQN